MQLTVLGCYGPYPAAGQNCSGYLLQDDGVNVLLDCGNGVLSRLRYHCQPGELDAVMLSHLHSDHSSDVMILRYALQINGRQNTESPLKVYAPPQPKEEYARLAYKNYLQSQPLSADSKLTIGKLQFTFSKGVHAVPSYVITVTAEGKKLVYSGDTAYFPALVEAVQGADLFLCEANFLKSDLQLGNPNHLAAYQAAEVAKAGGVKQLVLTHHHPERDPQQALAEAQAVFVNTTLARAGSLYRL
ncbi:MAG TPA: MBL fold metallo-hydrolase [Oscillospiraceae bacterium]|nr:MBL fold metallo-hydrolase [Oscillospiraceae bacterium]